MRFYEDNTNGTNYSGFKAGTLTTDQIWDLPNVDGSSNYLIDTDGAGVLEFQDKNSRETVTTATNYTIPDTGIENVIVSAAATITMPTAAEGRVVTIKSTTTSTVTLDPPSTVTIDGATTASITTQYDSISIISDGTNWFTY